VTGRKHYYPGEMEGASKKTTLFGKPKTRKAQKGGALNRLKDFLDEYF
jgi:hypothetical protein